MNLLLAAFPPELGPWLEAPPEGWTAACTGVGPLAAAVQTARLLGGLAPRRVLFIGTCGAYGEALPAGSLVSAGVVIDTSLSEVQGEAYRPGIQVSRWSASLHPPFPAMTVLAVPAITTSREGAERLGAHGDVEHLEVAGVFAACAAVGVPVGAALAVANRVGPDAHAEWKTNHRQVSERLRQELSEWMTGRA